MCIPSLLLLARATEKILVHTVEYLKTENRILRSKLPRRIEVTPAERARLIKLGVRLGSKLKDIITIVHPRTFARWVSEHRFGVKRRKRGRPRKPEAIRQLIVEMAKATGWGYRRILGELRKLRLHNVSRATIRRVLLDHGFDPGPKRGRGTWHEFIQRHVKTLWATDFFTKTVWTVRGPVTYYVLFFIHLHTRRVHIRRGARTVLVERNGYLGGMATAGLVNPIYGFNYYEPGRQTVGGIAQELVEQLQRIPNGTLGHRRREECGRCRSPEQCPTSGISSLLPFDPEAMKLAAERLVAQSGAATLFYCLADETMVRDGRLEGVVVSTKRGRRAIRAAVTIDATGDGDIAAAATAPFELGRSGDHVVQPQSLMFDRVRTCNLRLRRRKADLPKAKGG